MGMEQKKHKAKIVFSLQAWLLLSVNGLFAAANALSGTFVTIYIWKEKNEFSLIAWFALINQISMALTFWLAGKWVKEHNKMNCLRVGVALSAIFYLIVLLLQKKAFEYIWILGLVQGAASGLFWLAFNVVYFEVTNPQNRDKFNGWAGLLFSVVGMGAPWISGLLITRMAGATGYILIFSISLGVFVMAGIVSFFLKKRKVAGTYEWFHFFACLAQSGNPWRRVVPALTAQGIREGVFGFLIGLMVYIATKNEAKLGIYSLITSAVAFVSFMIAGKWLKPRHRSIAMLIGTVMLTVIIVPFFWKVTYGTLLIFGIGAGLFAPLFVIPMTSSVFDLIGVDETSAKQRVEYIVLRELSLNFGRMLGTLVFIFVIAWNKTPVIMSSLMLVIGSFWIASYLFMRKIVDKS